MSELTIRVIDADSREPIGGAEVGVFLYRYGGERPGAQLIRGTTNSEGLLLSTIVFKYSKEVSLAVVAAARAHYQKILGFSWGRQPFKPLKLSAEESKTVEVSLPPGRTIEGRVTDNQGRPIEGASVLLFEYYEGVQANISSVSFGISAGVDRPTWPPGCFTDKKGKFEWIFVSEDVDLPENEIWALQIQHDDFLEGRARAVGRSKKHPEGIVPISVILDKGRSALVRVVSKRGEPVPRARVRLLAWPLRVENPIPKFGETDDSGDCRFDGVAPLDYRIDVWAEHHRHFRGEIDLEQEENVETTIHVSPGCALEGRLVDKFGRGVSTRIVQALSGEDRMGDSTDPSDEQGHFRLLGLPPEGEVTVIAQHGRWAWELTKRVRLPSPPIRIWIPGLEVKGRVVSKPLNPPGRVRVHCWDRTQFGEVEEDGAFGPFYLQPGNYRLVVEIPGQPEVTQALEIPEEGLKSPLEISVPRP
ncbi:MAG: carboxypeptidase-like regulatory domain-containing protein [Planctomycetota bacterium]|nr:carboxypeptidase-like regulatory domain-containing protein [Planctomycetota bacterium]